MLLNLQKPLTSLSWVRRRWLIARSRIFDRKWYRAEYPESGVAGVDPIMHYLLSGADRGYRPHLLFDPAWYKNARGPRQRDQNPLVDYIKYGAREGIEPSPYFATAFYRKVAGGTGGLTPLGHFVAYGQPRGLAPTPLFDRAWYLENNPDVRRAGLDPFLHFVASGGKEGRSPGPLFDSAWYWMNNADAREELHGAAAPLSGDWRSTKAATRAVFSTRSFMSRPIPGKARRARRRWLFMPSAGAMGGIARIRFFRRPRPRVPISRNFPGKNRRLHPARSRHPFAL